MLCDAVPVRFGFEQRWDGAEVDEVVEVYLDPDFWHGLDALRSTAPPEVLGLERSGGTALVRLRYSLAVELPAEAARFIDTRRVSWVEESAWDLASNRAEVRFLPDQGGGLLRATASTAVLARDGGTVREVRGDLRVRVPLVGGRVERAIVEGIGEHLDAEAEAVAERLG